MRKGKETSVGCPQTVGMEASLPSPSLMVLLLLYTLLLFATLPSFSFYQPLAFALIVFVTGSLAWWQREQRVESIEHGAKSREQGVKEEGRYALSPLLFAMATLAISGLWFSQPNNPFSGGVFPHLLRPSPDAFAIALLALTLLLFLTMRFPTLTSVSPSPRCSNAPILSALILTAGLSVIFYGGLYQKDAQLIFYSRLMLWGCFFVILSYLLDFLPIPNRYIEPLEPLLRYRFPLLVIAAMLLRFWLIRSSPQPVIDVFSIFQGGADALLKGQNPYAQLYPSPYATQEAIQMGYRAEPSVIDDYSYLPATFLFHLPAYLLFSDIRYSYLASDLLTVWFLLKINGYDFYLLRSLSFLSPLLPHSHTPTHPHNRLPCEWLALLYLFHPRWSFLLEQSFSDPLLVFWASAVTFYLAQGNKDRAAFCLGLLMATKQYGVLLLPFFARFQGIKARHLLIALGVATGVCLPFVLWNPKEFFSDTIWQFVELPPRYDGLSFYAALYWVFGVTIPSWANFFSYALVAAWAAKRQSENLFRFLLSCALGLLSFFLFARFSYFQYYWLITNFLLLAMAVLLRDEGLGMRYERGKGKRRKARSPKW